MAEPGVGRREQTGLAPGEQDADSSRKNGTHLKSLPDPTPGSAMLTRLIRGPTVEMKIIPAAFHVLEPRPTKTKDRGRGRRRVRGRQERRAAERGSLFKHGIRQLRQRSTAFICENARVVVS